ncbi:MAG TPA: hypothetical protein PJ991_11425 [Kiritimatiellia bacterium]|nr:hypothetical protein [Kiritimatiellia bacterium]
MSKKLIYALLLIALSVVVMLLTKGTTKVELIVHTLSAPTSMILLGSVGVGVLIGLLLK